MSTAGRIRTCAHPGCRAVTGDGKAYCPDHLEHQPYVANLLSILEDLQEEVERVKERGSAGVDMRGMLVDEVLTRLASDHLGVATVDRLAKDMQQDAEVVSCVCMALARRGKLFLDRTSRGGCVVSTEKIEHEEDET